MTPDDVLSACLAVALVIACVGFLKLSIILAHGDVTHLFEPQWKREARELSRYIPTADEWGP